MISYKVRKEVTEQLFNVNQQNKSLPVPVNCYRPRTSTPDHRLLSVWFLG